MEVNTIYCGDCADHMATLPDDCVDLTVTSPPYDNLRTYNGFSFDFESVAQGLYRITKPGGIVVWVVGDSVVDGSETGTSFRQALRFKEIGFKLHDTMLYIKTGISFPGLNRYHQAFEYMFVFVKGKIKTYNLIADRKNLTEGHRGYGQERQPDGSMKDRALAGRIIPAYGIRYNYWLLQNRVHHTKHPAPFPEQLANDHIISWSNEGDLVYDPFMGSGTTAKMALFNQRNYLGAEMAEEYCKMAADRLAQCSFLPV